MPDPVGGGAPDRPQESVSADATKGSEKTAKLLAQLLVVSPDLAMTVLDQLDTDCAAIDPDLQVVVSAWTDLTPQIKSGIDTMIRAVATEKADKP